MENPQKLVMIGVVGFLLCLGGFSLAEDATGEKEPIKIELPEPFFGGTPLEGCFPNLEEWPVGPRPPFLAPKGTSLISRNKPVTSSVKAPISGELKMLVDGDKSFDPKSMIELDAGLQWVQIDLEAEYEIYAIVLWHFRRGKNFFFDVIVQVSNNPEFKAGLTTLYNADYDNSAGFGVGKTLDYVENHEGRLIDAKGAKARYVRCYSNGSGWDEKNTYVEVEVFGKPVKQAAKTK
jgi:hypothetical protein